jgi:hypothetical protein
VSLGDAVFAFEGVVDSDASLALRFGDCGDSGSGASRSLILRFMAMFVWFGGCERGEVCDYSLANLLRLETF